MALLASVERKDSVLAFAPYHDFLAAGERGEVCILSGAGDSGLELGCDYQFKQVTEFPSPAPVCRLSWSKAMWSFRMGLLAAGLANGQVVVWNPRVRDTAEDEGYFDKDFKVEIDDDYLSLGRPQKGDPLHAHGRSGNLARDVAGEQAGEQSEDEDASEWEVVAGEQAREQSEDEDASEWEVVAGEQAREQSEDEDASEWGFVAGEQAGEQLEDEDASEWEVVPNSGSSIVAMFAKHVGPVRGLSFGYRSNTLLASGGCHGRMLVWDLNDLSKDEIPTFEFTEGEGVDISALSWSRSDIIASTSNAGTSIWNMNVKSPLIRKLPLTRNCSAIEWSPSNENQMVVAGCYHDIPSIQLWDMRMIERPLKKLLEDARGVPALSWCPFDDHLLACTGSKKIVLLNVKNGEVVYEMAVEGACVDIRWSRKSEDHFALSSCERVDLYQRYPEI